MNRVHYPDALHKTSAYLLVLVPLSLSLLLSIYPGRAQSTEPGSTPTPTDTNTPQPTFLAATSPSPTALTTTTPTPTVDLLAIPTTEITTTETITPTATQTFSPTATPTPTITPTITITPTASLVVYVPFLLVQPAVTPVPYVDPKAVLFCDNFSSPLPIPDNKPAGVANTINISDNRIIADLNIFVDISHTWVGDLSIHLTHKETSKSLTVIDRPGYPASSQGCGNDDIVAILDDEFPGFVQNKCAPSPAAISGTFYPAEPLTQFDGDSITGNWVLKVVDSAKNDVGTLNGWCMVASISENPPPPTPIPPSPSLPAQARISNFHGQDQAKPLDCESRVAVDWARFFGTSINELQFFNRLPTSKNPDKGFVGDVNGSWGQIPPNPYGVHADPVAALLREYGVAAYAHRPLSWDDLRWEIAQGRPVFVWITGAVTRGIPVYYIPPDSLFTIVARFEHTVTVIGYNATSVTISDGSNIYTRSIDQFLDSWSALGNMAITARP